MRQLILLFLIPVAIAGRSQHAERATGTADSLGNFIRKVKTAYEKAAYLDFQVKYRYANAGRPGEYIDSLLGEVEMDKGRSRVVIDGMQSVQTDRYSINVLTDNKIIYLAAAGHGAGQNPVGVLDSAFARIKVIGAHVQHRDAEDALVIDFPPGQSYSRIEMDIDSRSGFFRRIVYSVSTAGLVAADMIESPGHPAAYQSKGQIEILFSAYRRGHFDDHVFSEDQFFTKTAGRYLPAGQFKDYQIYTASTNL